MGVTVLLVIIGTLGTVSKGLERDLEELEIGIRIETIQTTTFLRLARILRRFLVTRLAVTQTPVKDHQLMQA